MINEIESNIIENSLKPAHSKSPNTFYDLSSFLEVLKNAILQAPEVDEDQVKFFKEEIASERYQISNHRLAIKMLQDLEFA